MSPYAHRGAASSYASRAILESTRNGRFTFQVRPTSRPAIIYVKDVLQAVLDLVQAPRSRLNQCVYNIQAISPTAAEISEVIRELHPDVELEFQPNPQVADLIDSWPIVFDDARARNDWNWRPKFDLPAMIRDFVHDLNVG